MEVGEPHLGSHGNTLEPIGIPCSFEAGEHLRDWRGSVGDHSGNFEAREHTWDWRGSLGDHSGNFEAGEHTWNWRGSLVDHSGNFEGGDTNGNHLRSRYGPHYASHVWEIDPRWLQRKGYVLMKNWG